MLNNSDARISVSRPSSCRASSSAAAAPGLVPVRQRRRCRRWCRDEGPASRRTAAGFGIQVPVGHLERGRDAVVLRLQGEQAVAGLGGQVGQGPERMAGEHTSQQRDCQRQISGQGYYLRHSRPGQRPISASRVNISSACSAGAGRPAAPGQRHQKRAGHPGTTAMTNTRHSLPPGSSGATWARLAALSRPSRLARCPAIRSATPLLCASRSLAGTWDPPGGGQLPTAKRDRWRHRVPSRA